ncbi:MAG: dihydropteroate synthase, partial [Bacteroidales bacterium]|nr:dihydropteroate synthase [Bacteroidales bacterium]
MKQPDKNRQISQNPVLHCKGKTITFEKPLIMGILNITPDSFYDGGKYITDNKMLEQTGKMLNEGADFID